MGNAAPRPFRASFLKAIYDALDTPPQFHATDFVIQEGEGSPPGLSIEYRHAYFRFTLTPITGNSVLCSVDMSPGQATVVEHVADNNPERIPIRIAGWLARLAEDLAA